MRAAVALFPALMSALACAGTAPTLGPSDGRLAPCPSSPNCVSSLAEDARHRVEPLSLTGDPDAAWQRLRVAVTGLPRTRILEERPGYLRAECRSALFGFVDDLELLRDRGARQVQVRSASRLGYGDMGVNRRRVEELRRALDPALIPAPSGDRSPS